MLLQSKGEVELVVSVQELRITCSQGELLAERPFNIIHLLINTISSHTWVSTTLHSHTFEHEMLDYQLPEMLRVGLEDLVLQVCLAPYCIMLRGVRRLV